MTDKIKKLLAQLDQLERKKEVIREKILKAQIACSHPLKAIVEGAYVPREDGHSLPPFRVCRNCGYAEEGWYCGYSLLAPNTYGLDTIDRDKAWKLIIGVFWLNDVHTDWKRTGLIGQRNGEKS